MSAALAPRPRDYYETLGLPRDASPEEVKKRYRELALRLHPDRNKAPDAEERFKELSEAYAVLGDPQKRALYDQHGHAGLDQRYASPEDLFRGVRFEDIFGAEAAGFEEVLERLFGGSPFGPGRGRRGRGRDLQVGVRLTLEEVAEGATRLLEVPRRAACKGCAGTGARPGTGRRTCATCHGSGEQRVQRGARGFQFVQVAPCPRCRGQGSALEEPCGTCQGSGARRETARVEVEVPAGIGEGAALRIAGAGEAGPAGAGDLYVVVEVQPHERFERRGADLATVALVPFPTLALGGALELELLGGAREKVQVPPGTQAGAVLTLDGLGMPDGRGGRGDLHVLVQPEVPDRLSARARDLLRQLQEEWGQPRAAPGLRDALQGVFDKLGRRP